ncbi:hypothetical protein AV530_011859 [Patagioenas fasciata monilis]|uniref:Uncharacterized protein n=1 Tax=Patagioenas fasciata monilis TaxID=372326 RepID=A0A1V4JU16_PATFA|nr:hypothetical protein AV530_011859 [Patagioenas fasciata monilis]
MLPRPARFNYGLFFLFPTAFPSPGLTLMRGDISQKQISKYLMTESIIVNNTSVTTAEEELQVGAAQFHPERLLLTLGSALKTKISVFSEWLQSDGSFKGGAGSDPARGVFFSDISPVDQATKDWGKRASRQDDPGIKDFGLAFAAMSYLPYYLHSATRNGWSGLLFSTLLSKNQCLEDFCDLSRRAWSHCLKHWQGFHPGLQNL